MTRRFQFSLKWLFAATFIVAIAASVASWGGVLQKRSADFRLFASDRRREAKRIREVAKSMDEAGMTENAFYYDAVADYRERLALKYERAARSPWLPVGPDEKPPPQP